jgi:hypothetical protein
MADYDPEPAFSFSALLDGSEADGDQARLDDVIVAAPMAIVVRHLSAQLRDRLFLAGASGSN